MAEPAIEIREMRLEDGDAVRDIVCKEYMVMEPVSISLEVDPVREGTNWLNGVFPACLEQGLSLVAVDVGTGKVVGIRITGIVRKGKTHELPYYLDDPNTRKLALIFECITNLYGDINIFEKYQVDQYANLLCLCVAKDYQKLGIATKLVDKCLEIIKEKKLRVATVECSSLFSSCIFEKFGFEKLAEQNYETMVLDGKPVPMVDELKYHKRFSLYAKVLF